MEPVDKTTDRCCPDSETHRVNGLPHDEGLARKLQGPFHVPEMTQSIIEVCDQAKATISKIDGTVDRLNEMIDQIKGSVWWKAITKPHSL